MFVSKYYTIVGNLYSLVLLFSGQLPSTRPKFVPKHAWDNLELLCRNRQLIEIITIEGQFIEILIPEWYDVIIHSRCVYGPKLVRYTSSINSRFRWWGQIRKKITEFLPKSSIVIRNKKYKNSYIRRTIKLPKFLLDHFYIKKLYDNKIDHYMMMERLSYYFFTLIQGFTYLDIHYIFHSSEIYNIIDENIIYKAKLPKRFWKENKQTMIIMLNSKCVDLFF